MAPYDAIEISLVIPDLAEHGGTTIAFLGVCGNVMLTKQSSARIHSSKEYFLCMKILL